MQANDGRWKVEPPAGRGPEEHPNGSQSTSWVLVETGDDPSDMSPTSSNTMTAESKTQDILLVGFGAVGVVYAYLLEQVRPSLGRAVRDEG